MDFWNFTDYKRSDIRVIKTVDKNKKSGTCIIDKGDNVSYSDFLQDALDHKLVNTAFIEDEDNGMIFLKSTKFIKAYSQLLINFGKNSWIVKFSNYECSLANSAYNTMMKKAMSIYSIKKIEIIKAMTDFKTSEI